VTHDHFEKHRRANRRAGHATRRQRGHCRKAANIIGEMLCEAHRGAIKCRSGLSIVFANDGYKGNDRSKLEVDLLRQRLEDSAVAELAFGFCPAGYTWVMLVDSGNTAQLDDGVWEATLIAFAVGGTVNSVQRG